MDESATLSSFQLLKASTSASGVTAAPAAEMDVEAEIVIGTRQNEDMEGEGDGEGEGETRTRRRRDDEVEVPMEEVQYNTILLLHCLQPFPCILHRLLCHSISGSNHSVTTASPFPFIPTLTISLLP
jgi:hypothetical protein